MDEALRDQIARLELKVKRTQQLLAAVVVATAAAVLVGAASEPQIIRARGVVISDAAGNDRILIGAPAPKSSDRKRSGAETASMVFMSAEGHDRVIVGQSPDPFVGGVEHRRIGEAHGLTFFDPKGSERGGIGYLDSGRAVVALDYHERDAIGMMVDDRNGFAGMLVAHKPPANSAAILMGVQDGVPSLAFSDSQARERAKLQIDGAVAPAWLMSPAAKAKE